MTKRRATSPIPVDTATLSIRFTVTLTEEEWKLLVAHASVFIPAATGLNERERIERLLQEFGTAVLRDVRKQPLTRHLVTDTKEFAETVKVGCQP